MAERHRETASSRHGVAAQDGFFHRLGLTLRTGDTADINQQRLGDVR